MEQSRIFSIWLFMLLTTLVRSQVVGVSGQNATYDYVIIGGGTAGLTIATRLADDSPLSVAVIEAGGFYEIDNGNASVVPYYDRNGLNATSLAGSNPLVDWQFLTTRQPSLLNQTYHYARGKCLGGSSAVNFMIYQRATVGALQQWADEVGDQSYRWENMLQWYQKSTNYTPANTELRLPNATAANDTDAFIAGAGPLHVSYPNYANPLGTYYPDGFRELGLSALPDGVNTGSLIGYGYLTATENPENETRSSSQSSFLNFAAATTKLTVYTKTMAEKIIFDKRKSARAVSVMANNVSFTLFARKEIILSAGAVQSPHLLMVSGIGPSTVLQRYDIPVIVDLPGVGQNLQDNPGLFFAYATPYALNVSQLAEAVIPYHANLTGQLTSPGGEVIGFDKVSNKNFSSLSPSTIASLKHSFSADWPEIELISYASGGTVFSVLTTFSRGNITISSSSIYDPPVIDIGWFSDTRDREIAIAAFRYTRQLEATKSLQKLMVEGELAPGNAVQSDEQIWEYIQEASSSLYHACSTNKMGRRNDTMAVVDSEARVYGVSNLRVVDISAFPFLVPGQPQSMVYALAEKIADNILRGNKATIPN